MRTVTRVKLHAIGYSLVRCFIQIICKTKFSLKINYSSITQSITFFPSNHYFQTISSIMSQLPRSHFNKVVKMLIDRVQMWTDYARSALIKLLTSWRSLGNIYVTTPIWQPFSDHGPIPEIYFHLRNSYETEYNIKNKGTQDWNSWLAEHDLWTLCNLIGFVVDTKSFCAALQY